MTEMAPFDPHEPDRSGPRDSVPPESVEWTPTQRQRLERARERVRAGTLHEQTLAELRLEFARWLVRRHRHCCDCTTHALTPRTR